jgi:hypothetical protein
LGDGGEAIGANDSGAPPINARGRQVGPYGSLFASSWFPTKPSRTRRTPAVAHLAHQTSRNNGQWPPCGMALARPASTTRCLA